MGVKDGLLALLAEGPKHGYQLKAEFDEATGGAWSLNIGQVYSSLQRLERDGLVEGHDEGERRAYRLTLAGAEALDAWWDAGVPRSVEDRDEVVMKILIAVRSAKAAPLRVVRAQRDSVMRTLQATVRERHGGQGDLAWQLHLDRLALTCRAELDWLDLVEERLANGPVAVSGDAKLRRDEGRTA